MKEQTLVIVKPDAVKRRFIGKIITDIEQWEYDIVKSVVRTLTYEEAAKFYKEHEGKDYFDRLCKFTSSGPLMALLVEGKDVIKQMRYIIGDTYPEKAQIFTLRYKFGWHSKLWNEQRSNAVHCSDSIESAKREINFFFGVN